MPIIAESDKIGVLSKIFQNGSSAKILDFFLDHKDLDYSVGEIAEKAEVSIQTVSKEISNLESLNLIVNYRTIGKTNMYRLNTRLRAILLLSEFTLQISQIPAIQEYRGYENRQEVLEAVSTQD